MAKAKRFLNVDFKPDIKEVQQDFVRLSARMEDKHEVMTAAMAVAHRDIERMFDEQQDAHGNDWEYWKQTPPAKGGQSYATRAENLPNIGILNRADDEGGLRDKATSFSAFQIVGDRLTYGDNLPEWAGVHLHGGKTMVGDDGYVIPQRSFYPYSPEGVAEVESVFDAWMAENIAVMPRTSTRGKQYIQVQNRTSIGRFGSSAL